MAMQYPLPSSFTGASRNDSSGTRGEDSSLMLSFPGGSHSSTENTRSPNLDGSLGHAQLYSAIVRRSEKELDALLLQGAPVDVRDRLGYEPLHYAVRYGDEKLTNPLLNFGASVDSKIRLDRTALHLAVYNKTSLSTLKALLQVNCNVNAQDKHGDTPLHLLLVKICLEGPIDESI